MSPMDSEALRESYGDLQALRDDERFKQQNRIAARAAHDDLFDKLAEEIHPINIEKGFWDDPEFMDKVAGKLALVHSEVTEILEALRKDQGSAKVTEEFADTLIRLLDLHKVLVERHLATPGLLRAVTTKMAQNKERPPKHGHVWG